MWGVLIVYALYIIEVFIVILYVLHAIIFFFLYDTSMIDIAVVVADTGIFFKEY